MTTSAPLPEKSISEAELTRLAGLDKLDKIHVVETAQGFYVLAKSQGRPSATRYLATRRITTKPRMFRDLKRLNDLLRSIYPLGTIELTCEQVYKGKQVKKVAKKKAKAKK